MKWKQLQNKFIVKPDTGVLLHCGWLVGKDVRNLDDKDESDNDDF